MFDNKKLSVAITGGGTEFISNCLRVGGASHYFLNAVIPYSYENLQQFLGYKPAKACSQETARKMALNAWRNELRLFPELEDELVGVGVTASLARPDYPGEVRDDGTHRKHEAYVALHSKTSTIVYSLEFTNYDLDRKCEEKNLADCIFQCIENTDYFHPKVDNCKSVLTNELTPPLEIQSLMCGKTSVAKAIQKHEISDLIYPGAFNPLHEGHERLAKAASLKTGLPVTFEICINNIEKAPLDYIDLEERFVGWSCQNAIKGLQSSLIFTNLPKFEDKAIALPNKHWLMGSDTANRILDKKYLTEKTFETLENLENQFIIGVRKGCPVNPEWHNYTHMILQDAEYVDTGISSSELRNK